MRPASATWEVTAGVEVGELVVVGNLSLLRNGLLVTLDSSDPDEQEDGERGGLFGGRQDDEE